MAHLERFDFGITTIEDINVDHKQEAREYTSKMYKRIRCLEKPAADAVQNEILEATSSSSSSNSVTFYEDTIQKKIPTLIQVKKLVQVEIDGDIYQAPIFHKPDQMEEWNRILSHHEKRINDIVDKLKQIGREQMVTAKMASIHRRLKGWTPKDTKDKSTVMVGAMEKIIEYELGEFGLKMQNVSTSVDSLTQGLWVKEQESSEIQKFLESLGTRRVILTQRCKFNSQQADNLVKMMFSAKPDIRAKAKLDLMSRIDYSVQKDLLQDAEKVLEIILVEAYLTQDEILHTLFQINDKLNDHTCIACLASIRLVDNMCITESAK